jgi:hypothetical protein
MTWHCYIRDKREIIGSNTYNNAKTLNSNTVWEKIFHAG